MILRRWPILAVVLVAFVAAVGLARNPAQPPVPVFSEAATPWMPAVQQPGEGDAAFGSTWFCPGVFAAGASGTSGEIAVVNPTDGPLRAVITAFGEPAGTATTAPGGDTVGEATPTSAADSTTGSAADEPGTRTVDLPPRTVVRQNVAELRTGTYVATVVEFDRTGGFVEQVATAPVGSAAARSIGACATAPSAQWYFAAGNTDGDSTDVIVIANPYDHSAVVDVRIDSPRGPRQLRDAMPVPAQSVRTVELTSVIADQPWVGVNVTATRGSVVAGRSQLFATDALSGYAMTLGTPTLSSYWWFAFGLEAENVSARFLIYNPGDRAVTITPAPVGVPLANRDAVIDSVTVPGHTVYELDPGAIEAIGEGPYSMVITTAEPDQRVVVERQHTRTISGVPTTSLTMGGLNRPDGGHPSTWYVGVPFDEPTEGGLQLLNAGGDGAVSVVAVRPEGLVPLSGLTDRAVPSGGLAVLDITDANAIGVPLIVRSDFPMIVERVLPREPNAQGRVAVWAVPSA